MEFAGIILQALTMVGAVVTAFVGLYTRANVANLAKELATLRTEISAGRAEDREENRNWINGSFMRASTVEAKLEHFEGWLGGHEKRLDRLENKKD